MGDKQTSLFPPEPPAGCELCGYYSPLKQPRERSDGATIYGYCFKAGDKDYSSDMGKGYAVFIQGGSCKQFKKRKKEDPNE